MLLFKCFLLVFPRTDIVPTDPRNPAHYDSRHRLSTEPTLIHFETRSRDIVRLSLVRDSPRSHCHGVLNIVIRGSDELRLYCDSPLKINRVWTRPDVSSHVIYAGIIRPKLRNCLPSFRTILCVRYKCAHCYCDDDGGVTQSPTFSACIIYGLWNVIADFWVSKRNL